MAKQEDVLRSIGERLKKAREAKGLTIAQVYIKTHIHTKVLFALEDGRIDNMLSLIYAKGFLKKYSGFLGFNDDEIIREYLSIHAVHKEPLKEQLKEPPAKPVAIIRSSAFKIPQNWYLYAVILILAVGVILIVTSLFKPHQGTGKVKQSRRITKQPLSPRPVKPARRAVAKASKAALLTTVSIPRNEPIIITLRVKRPVLVRAAEDDGVRFDSVLKAGVVETLKAQNKINLKIGDAKALDIFLNGKPLAIARKGEIKDLEITRRRIRIK